MKITFSRSELDAMGVGDKRMGERTLDVRMIKGKKPGVIVPLGSSQFGTVFEGIRLSFWSKAASQTGSSDAEVL